LFNNSKEILNRIVDLWNPKFDQADLLTQIRNYTNQLLETYLANQKCSLKIRRSLVERVDSFEIFNQQFLSYRASASKDLPLDSMALIDKINALINESNFFILQFNATVDLIWPSKRFPFKPQIDFASMHF